MHALAVARGVGMTCLLAACHAEPHTVRVIATDYALQAPDSIGPGTTEFVLQNRGRVVHELVVGLLRPGAGLAQMVEAAQRNARLRDLGSLYLDGPPFGALMSWPGATSPSRFKVDLQSGRDYALLCQLRDTTTSPQHTALGMVHVLHVR
jgi:hypothetical protein